MPWRWLAGAAALLGLAACGVDIVGSLAPSTGNGTSVVDASISSVGDGNAPAASADAQDDGSNNAAADAGAPPPVLPDGGDEGGDAALPPVDASVCTPPGYGCTATTTCCSGNCTANDTCGTCSSNLGAQCWTQNDCCLGTYCGYGRYGKECFACVGKDKDCTANVQCCSGQCTFRPNAGPGGPPGPPGPPGGNWACK